MQQKEKNIINKRLINAYVSSVISISLVLLLVGLASLLLVNARGLSDYFKENMQISILFKQDVEEEEAIKYRKRIESERYIKDAEYISKEKGKQEMMSLLGEDFLDVFETSPIPISIEITMKADYVSVDSLDMVKTELSSSSLVDEIVYQKSLVEALNTNLSKISIVLAVFIALLLFISFVLINNTIRLNVFSKRFTIHTMNLVGATKSFIRAPFLVQALFQALFASVLAVIMLLIMLFFLRSEFIQLFEIFNIRLLLVVIGIIIGSGIFICISSTYLVVNKLITFKKDDLYF